MKDFMMLVTLFLGVLSTIFGVIGGIVLLRTWWLISLIVFGAKIFLIATASTVALSWWWVILMPVLTFGGGLFLVALAGFIGIVIASIIETY